ncbi:MAG: rod shape-determining protein MreC [Patescibacteria group bacterium]
MLDKPTLFSRLKPLLAFLAVIVVFFIVKRLPIIGGGIRTGEGILSDAGAVISRGVTRFFASEDSLTARLSVCLEDKTALARDAVEFEKLKDENAELREELAYTEHVNTAGIAAMIIAKSLPEDPLRVVIDRGRADGVKEGSVVVVGQGVVLGTIKSIDEHSSLVTLLTGIESKVPAAIIGKKRTIGLAEGRNGAVMNINFIPRDADVARGDVVTTSGLNGNIPEGLLLGTVTEVIDLPSAPFKSALLEPFADPLEWSHVLILPPSAS